ncbi:O-antigen ligase family protein [Flavisericum labens]|uniref:O-antigen ligase family protein n=1 Tax=Flavisericum labens TaxID=3377112 RepID=UPI00387B5DC6
MNVTKKIKKLINSRKFLLYLLALTLSLILIGYFPSSFVLGLFIVFSVRYAFLNKIKLSIEHGLLLPIFLYILFAMSFFWSQNQNLTIIGLERMVSLVLIPIAFNVIPKFSVKDYHFILKIFTKVNLLFGVFFLVTAGINYIKIRSLSVFTYHELVGCLGLNAIYVSVIFSISLFYLLSKKDNGTAQKIKILFFLTLLLLLSSKTILAVLFVGIIIYAFRNGKRIFKNKKVILVILFALAAFTFSANSLIERLLFEKRTKVSEVINKEQFGKIYPWTGSSIRLLQLRILKEQLEEESIFLKGFGLFASRENLKKRHKNYDTYPVFHSYNYHNQYAQVFSEAGVFGLILLISMLVYVFFNGIKSKDYLFIMFAFTIFLIFMTESLLWRQKGLFLFIILYCLLIRVDFKSKEMG